MASRAPPPTPVVLTLHDALHPHLLLLVTSTAAPNKNTMLQFGRAGGRAQRRWSEQRGAHRGSRLHALKRMVSAVVLRKELAVSLRWRGGGS